MRYRPTMLHSLQRSLLLLLMQLFAAVTLQAHEGEDHGAVAAQPAAGAVTAAQGSVLTTSTTTELFELVVKYPPSDAGEPQPMQIYLADFATNRPISGATFSLRWVPSDAAVVTPPTMLSPGIYDLVARLPSDTIYRLIATVKGEGRTDFVEVEGIHSGEAAETFLASQERPVAPADTSRLWTPLEYGAIALVLLVLVGTILLLARRRTISRSREGKSIARDPELAAGTDAAAQRVDDTEHPGNERGGTP